MFKALPVDVWRMIWKQYYTSVVLRELVAKTTCMTFSGFASNGVCFAPINCPSSIRWRWTVAKTKRARDLRLREFHHEREAARAAQKLRNHEIAKRDFADWFALTGSTQRLSKRKKVIF